MMRMRSKGSAAPAFMPMKESVESTDEALEWEVRPCGMLVQKRNPNSDFAAIPAPTIRVRVKYGSAYHEIHLSSQTTFGELKKLLSARTGLNPGDQKLVYKDRERDSSAYLDTSGVRDKSKMVLLEDTAAQAKRCLEMRRAAKAERAAKSVSQISLEVDKLASQVADLEAIISKGGKVAEKEVLNLIELLMTELIKLDGIIPDGDVQRQRRMQVRRVQKYVETLDVLKIKNAMSKADEDRMVQHGRSGKQQEQQHKERQAPSPVIVTTKWEVFDSLFSPTASTAATTTTSTTTSSTTTSSTPTPRFDWELF